MSKIEELMKAHEVDNFGLFGKAFGKDNIIDKVTGVLDDLGINNLEVNGSKDLAKVDGKKMTISEFTDNYKTSSGLNYFEALKAASEAQSDDDVMDVIHKLSQPEKLSREEAQDTYNEYFGYDPTTFYDKKEISEKLTRFEAEEGNPRDLVESHDEVVEAAMEYYNANRDYGQAVAIKQAMAAKDIDEDLISKFDKIVQSLALDDDDDDIDMDELFDSSDDDEDEDDASLFGDDSDDEDDED